LAVSNLFLKSLIICFTDWFKFLSLHQLRLFAISFWLIDVISKNLVHQPSCFPFHKKELVLVLLDTSQLRWLNFLLWYLHSLEGKKQVRKGEGKESINNKMEK
jgi:hypothetical protein